MISRVAESCFWMLRHIERMDTQARVLKVNAALLLDLQLPEAEAWRPLLIVAGEEPRFAELHGEGAAEKGELVQEYLTWDERNPVSIARALYWARENARTIRETISLEMWEAINELWLWLRGGAGRRLYNRERIEFYDHVKQRCQLFHGVTHDTMLHGEPFDFMRLGLALERANQTARILDVRHHALGPSPRGGESAVETAEWMAILRSCLAYEPFFKCSVAPLEGRVVAGFLLLRPEFPRSVRHCLERADNFLRRIRSPESPEIGRRADRRLRAALRHVRGLSLDSLEPAELHDELTAIIDATARICKAVHEDFFAAAAPASAT